MKGALDWTSVVAQGGPFALVVVLFILGKIVPGTIYDKRVEEVHELQARNDTLTRIVEDKVIPALIRSTDLLARDLERTGHERDARDARDDRRDVRDDAREARAVREEGRR